MLEQDDELKDLFRQKNLENDFPVDEQNWEKMASVLKDEQKGRRRGLVYFSLLILLSLGSMWFIFKPDEKITATKALKLQQPQTIANTALPGKQSGELAAHKAMGRKNSIPEKARAPIAKSSLPKVLKTQPKPEQESFKHELVNAKTRSAKATPGANTLSSLASKATLPGKQVSSLALQNGSSSQQSNKETRVLTNSKTSNVLTTQTYLTNEPTNTSTATTSTTENNLAEQEYKNLIINENPNRRDSVTPDFNTKAKYLPDTNSTVTKDTNAVITKVQESSAGNLITPKDSILFKPQISQLLFLEAGFNYLQGWNTNNKTEARGFNPLIGLNYYHAVSKKTGFSIGLHYTSINHLSSTSHTSSASRIRFGEESDVTVISALNMHYLLIPLKLSFEPNNNNFISLGYTMAYLLDVQSKVEKYSTRINYSSAPVVSKSMGYTKGFNSFDGQLTLCYRRRLYKELYMSGEFFYGLQDIKNNLVYATNKFERAYGFRLSLNINLWKK